jgi:hypothetical protein
VIVWRFGAAPLGCDRIQILAKVARICKVLDSVLCVTRPQKAVEWRAGRMWQTLKGAADAIIASDRRSLEPDKGGGRAATNL